MAARALPFDREQVRSIAILRVLQLGDLLAAVPALRSIRAGFPNAEITLVGLPWAAWFAGRFRHYVDRFVAFGGHPGITEAEFDPARSARFFAEQRAYGYDLVIQLHGSGRTSNEVARALGGRWTAAHYEGERPEWLTIAAPYPDHEPEVLRNLGLARLLGCPDLGTSLELPLLPEDVVEADALLAPACADDRPLVGVHPGARPPARRWPAERFAVVADHLAREHGARIVLTGGPGEEEITRIVANAITAPVLDLAGRTSLGGLAALIARLDLFVSNDTGPAHVARAVGTPSVTIFGPADARRWAPLDRETHRIVRRPVACSPCTYWECPIDHRCMNWIAPDMVVEAAERQLMRRAIACDD